MIRFTIISWVCEDEKSCKEYFDEDEGMQKQLSALLLPALFDIAAVVGHVVCTDQHWLDFGCDGAMFGFIWPLAPRARKLGEETVSALPNRALVSPPNR